MTFLSLTDGCRLLAIDAKTLRRWLAQAQLTLQPHPTDARLKGVTGDQLRLLASAHHRSLPALPEELPPLAPTVHPEASPPLPRELFELLQTLGALPAQIAALQQQLAGLTQVLHPPPVTASPAHDGAPGVGQPKPTKASARSRLSASCATKRPRPPAHVLPLVEYGTGGHYVVICPKGGLLPLEPDTPQWFAWLATLSSFRFVGQQGRLTAHREVERLPGAAWRAHRSIRSHTYNLRLGSTEALTIATLEQAATTLHAHLK
jgi:hypothetical protein